MPLVIATSNPGKLREFRGLLPSRLELVTAAELGLRLPPEDGETYADNALLKARSVAREGFATLADDSGLEIDALDGAPGVRSARYAGDDANDVANNAKVLLALSDVVYEVRTARFRSVVALVLPDCRSFLGHGTVEGRIGTVPRGSHGFGYDPLFELDDADTLEENGHTLAELAQDRKNQISHRARAIRDLMTSLDNQGIQILTLTGDHPGGQSGI